MALVFPDIGTTNGKVEFSDAANWLTDCANAIAAESNIFLSSLRDVAAIDFFTVGEIPVYNSVVWLGSAAGITAVPARPVISIGPIQALLDQLTQLIAPTAPPNTFSYTEPGYNSQLRQPMIEKLLFDVVNGGYGIDTNDEVALFNRARDREALLAMAAVEEVKRQAAATSFPLPQGSLNAALQRARQDEMAKNSSVNRDIALKRADLFVANRRQVIEQIIATEGQEIALYNAIQNRILTAAQIEIQVAISLFDAGIKLYQSKIQALTEQIDANLQAADTVVKIYASDVAAYAALVNAVTSGAQIDIANSRNVLERDIRVYESKVNQVKFQLEKLSKTVENTRSINQYGAEFFRTGLGASMTGISGLATTQADI
jgi:hypothetical protein